MYKNQAQKDSYELKDTTFEIGSEGGTIKVPISANADYTIEVAADSKNWITVTKTKALSNYIIELTVAKNTNPDSRQGSVKVKMNRAESTITITQSQMDELIVDKKTFEIGSKGGPIYIPIKANIEYTSEILESGKGWIEISNNQTKGLEDYKLVLNIKENKDYDGRVGQVKVIGAGKESVITITQSQLDELIITNTSYEIGNNGETISVPIKANIDFEFSIISGSDWLKAEKLNTKSLGNYFLHITASKNEADTLRVGKIKVSGACKSFEITIYQSDYIIIHNDTAGLLKDRMSSLDLSLIKKLAIFGPINEEDVRFIRDNCSNLTHLDMGKATSITTIGDRTFYSCYNLTSIIIPQGVTAIEEWAFCQCHNLEFISIPSSVTYIGNGTFSSCWSLTSIIIPNNVTHIEKMAFYGCTNLAYVYIPNSVIYIGSAVFGGAKIKSFDGDCSLITSDRKSIIYINNGELKSVNSFAESLDFVVPSEVYRISSEAFYNCTSLSSVSIHEGVNYIGESAFRGCHNLSSINLPNGLTAVERYCFSSCYKLTTITIPDSVNSIKELAFSSCQSLKYVYLRPLVPPSLVTSAFDLLPSDAVFFVPRESLSEYKNAQNWTNYASQIQPFDFE